MHGKIPRKLGFQQKTTFLDILDISETQLVGGEQCSDLKKNPFLT